MSLISSCKVFTQHYQTPFLYRLVTGDIKLNSPIINGSVEKGWTSSIEDHVEFMVRYSRICPL